MVFTSMQNTWQRLPRRHVGWLPRHQRFRWLPSPASNISHHNGYSIVGCTGLTHNRYFAKIVKPRIMLTWLTTVGLPRCPAKKWLLDTNHKLQILGNNVQCNSYLYVRFLGLPLNNSKLMVTRVIFSDLIVTWDVFKKGYCWNIQPLCSMPSAPNAVFELFWCRMPPFFCDFSSPFKPYR